MSNLVSAKFFRVLGDGPAPDFLGVLKSIFEKDLSEREKNINPGVNNPVIVRLERLVEEADGDYVNGELIRKQTINIPPNANDHGLAAIDLGDGGGLGYSSAFIYHKQTKVLLIQSNPIAVTYSRLALYTMFHNPAASYKYDPVPTDEAWARFNRGLPRKLVIKLASPQNLPHAENAPETVGGSAANVAEELQAPYITIEVSMGNKRGSLGVEAVRNVLNHFRNNEQVDVRHLSASVKPDGSGTDVIDFLEEFMAYRDVFDLPDRDPVRNFEIRRDALRTAFNHRLASIRQRYIPQGE